MSKEIEMWKITVNDYRFKYVGGFNYKNYWVIQKRFLWLFWRNYKKMSYQILDDGYPNINEVMDYVELLNQNKDE
jgi:hypothetical protein